ncbi:conserved hypothetical protein [delta proteobacterium NaphS2]|nr:conserved hypothetical protein [delta proteobacterium NaphS2]
MEQTATNRLKYFPITLFASVMGLAGLSIKVILPKERRVDAGESSG